MFREAFGNALKPPVDGAVVYINIRNPLFIQQRRHRFILYCSLHGIGVDDGAEFIGGLIVFQQWRPGEGNERRIRQRQLHANMVFAALATVAFVDQHDHIGAVVMALWQLGR